MTYQNSLFKRSQVMMQLTVTRVADAVILLLVSTLPVLAIAAMTESLGYALAALLGWGASIGASVARDIFDAGGYKAIIRGEAGQKLTAYSISDLAVGVVYANAVIGVSTLLGVVVGSLISIPVGLILATGYGTLDMDWGRSPRRIGPVWIAVSTVASWVGNSGALERLHSAAVEGEGLFTHLTQSRRNY